MRTLFSLDSAMQLESAFEDGRKPHNSEEMFLKLHTWNPEIPAWGLMKMRKRITKNDSLVSTSMKGMQPLPHLWSRTPSCRGTPGANLPSPVLWMNSRTARRASRTSARSCNPLMNRYLELAVKISCRNKRAARVLPLTRKCFTKLA